MLGLIHLKIFSWTSPTSRFYNILQLDLTHLKILQYFTVGPHPTQDFSVFYSWASSTSRFYSILQLDLTHLKILHYFTVGPHPPQDISVFYSWVSSTSRFYSILQLGIIHHKILQYFTVGPHPSQDSTVFYSWASSTSRFYSTVLYSWAEPRRVSTVQYFAMILVACLGVFTVKDCIFEPGTTDLSVRRVLLFNDQAV